jgi:hypothetical protein
MTNATIKRRVTQLETKAGSQIPHVVFIPADIPPEAEADWIAAKRAAEGWHVDANIVALTWKDAGVL